MVRLKRRVSKSSAMSAAGAAVGALAGVSHGAVVYTAANTVVSSSGTTSVGVDFDHDNFDDFTISADVTKGIQIVKNAPNFENDNNLLTNVGNSSADEGALALALHGGDTVTSLATGNYSTSGNIISADGATGNFTVAAGAQYLGIVLMGFDQTNGGPDTANAHYGYIKFQTLSTGAVVSGKVLGYAYETTAATTIMAGQGEPAVSAVWAGGNGNWSNAGQWSTAPSYPQNSTSVAPHYAVTINTGTVSLDVNTAVSSVTLGGGSGAWTAKLDVGTHQLIIQAADGASKAAAFSTLVNQVLSGKNGGTWDGNGVMSSAIVGNPNATLALVDNADLGWTSAGGRTLDSNSIIVVRALLGDANLDGNVDLADYDVWYKHVGTGTPYSYAAGDLNMDGNIDLGDYDVWYKHVGAAPLSVAAGAAAVPEPTSLAMLALGAAGVAAYRRRPRRS